jgi:hypothetical protein
LRRAIIECCGKVKCSTAFSKLKSGKNSSSSGKDKNSKNKNNTANIVVNGNVGKV